MPDLIEVSQEQVEEAFSAGCPECVAIGGSWVHLRMCLVCAHVGCCDSSPKTHATKHFEETRHAVVRSIEPGENWKWDYESQSFSI